MTRMVSAAAALASASRNDAAAALRRLLQRKASASAGAGGGPRRATAAVAAAATTGRRNLGTVRPRLGSWPEALSKARHFSSSSRLIAPPSTLTSKSLPWPMTQNGGARLKSSVAAIEESPPDASVTVQLPPNTIPIPFLLADIGEGIAEVELLQWHVTPGQYVKEHDVVADVQSDKATVPLTSRYEGVVVDLCGMQGDMIETGSPLMHIAVEKGKYGTATDAGGGGGGGGGGAAVATDAQGVPAAAADHVPAAPVKRGGAPPPPPAAAAAAVPTGAGGSAGGAGKKIVPFLMADIGEGIVEVELLQWYVSPGDYVRSFDTVAEVQSDKATVPVTSRYEGTVVDLCGDKGDVIKVGRPLMRIEVKENEGAGGGSSSAGGAAEASGGADGNADETAAAKASSATLHNVDDAADRLHIPSVPPSHFPTSDETAGGCAAPVKVLASPAVRKLGKDHNINLATISGSGPKGRILKADILRIVGGREEPPAPAPPAAATAATAFAQQVATAGAAGTASGESTKEEEEDGGGTKAAPKQQQVQSPQYHPGQDVTVPLRGYSRLMVKTMTSSLRIPHMVYADEVDASNLLAVRARLRPSAQSKGGATKLTLLPFLIKASSLALMEYPLLNSQLEEGGNSVILKGNHDIGVAMDTPRGLAVPVVRKCQERSVLEIATELERLQKLAADGGLTEADLTNPSFTLSNIGSIGGTYMSPVVAPPQVAIGAIGKIQRLPRFVEGTSLRGKSMEVKEAHIMNVSWGGDHRVIDGATMARFSECWRGYVEDPGSMMLVTR